MPLGLVTLAVMRPQRGGDDEQSLDELLMGAARALRRRWSAGLGDVAGIELSPHEARALRTIGHHGPTRLGVIAEHLRIAPRSATDVVDRLESRGLVMRAPDPSDRRAMTVSLTELGTDVLAQTRLAPPGGGRGVLRGTHASPAAYARVVVDQARRRARPTRQT